jgi:hypothetical protein
LVDDFKEPLEVEALERCQVDTMVDFPWQGSNFDLINFDVNMRDILGYWIQENRVPFSQKRESPRRRRRVELRLLLRNRMPQRKRRRRSKAPRIRGKRNFKAF